MSQFEIIKDILGNLRKEEIRSLRRFLKLFEEGAGTNQLKSLQVLDMLLNAKNYPEETVCKKIYGDSSTPSLKTFNKILSRLKDKVFEALILDINLYRKDSHDNLNMAISEVRKLLLQVNILEEKAPVQEILKLYEKIKSICKTYELYDELLQAFSGKIAYSGKFSGSGLAYADENMTEVLFFDRCRHSLLKARNVYSSLVYTKYGQTQPPDRLVYEQAIEELEHEYRYTKSASIGYLLFDLTCHYQQSIRNYDAAEKSCNKVISLVSENPSVYKNERMTGAFLSLANVELLKYKFKQTESTLARARFYGKGKFGLETEITELSFLSLFYRGSYEKALQLLSTRFNEKNENLSVESGKNNYYRAAVNILLGKTHESFLFLQQTNDLEKDQPAWNIGVRLLVIFNLLESEKLEAVESHVENLKKFIDRSEKAGFRSQRSGLILKILSSLMKESFDYSAVWIKEKNNLSLLESTVPEYAWSPKSPEIIVFQLWIAAKALKKNYQHLVDEWFNGQKKLTHELRLFD